MDPLSATSPDELRDSCAASAYRVARRVQGWDAAEPVVRSALDAGLAVLDHVTSADLEAVTAWRPPAEKRGNSVYLDSTTVTTAARLLAGERTPSGR